MALQGHAAGVTDPIAVLLEAGRDLKLVGEDVLAEAVRVAATGFFFGRGMRQRALRQSRAGRDKEDGEKRKNVKHGDPRNI
jgi:hypothetical protein